MAFTANKVEMWTGEIDDRIGGLAALLEPLAEAGVDLEVVVARRQPGMPGKGPHGADTNAPTTFFVDGAGTVRWVFRPERFISRLSPDELLTAMDQHAAK